ncbi:hypothetical protein [Luteolibacter sp. LG18]|uniref:hypothetical protein n=1 Tax=Luteolibacter sp. LG18 TaxID=2819286 RepID=UPI0030C77129
MTVAILVALGLDFVRWSLRTHPKITFALSCILLPAALLGHLHGYKLYGSATVIDNRPILDSPRQLAGVAEPNVVIATDGSRFELKGITFEPVLLEITLQEISGSLNRNRDPILFQPDPRSPSGMITQWRCRYFCGNTFEPMFVPKRLPAYTRQDLGLLLVGRRLATRNAPSPPVE